MDGEQQQDTVGEGSLPPTPSMAELHISSTFRAPVTWVGIFPDAILDGGREDHAHAATISLTCALGVLSMPVTLHLCPQGPCRLVVSGDK